MNDLDRDGIAKTLEPKVLEEYGIDPERFTRALDVVEACYQNGHSLAGDEGSRSIAHFAVSAPDVALLAALVCYDAPIDLLDEDGISPAYLLALRMVAEPVEGRKCARLMRDSGVSFLARNGDRAPIQVLDEWPGFWEQWKGWKEKNESPEAEYRMGTLLLFLAYLKHRSAVRDARKWLRNLG